MITKTIHPTIALVLVCPCGTQRKHGHDPFSPSFGKDDLDGISRLDRLAASSEAEIVSRLKKAKITAYATEANSLLSNSSLEAPVQPNLVEFNSARARWFSDPEHDLRFVYLKTRPFLTERSRCVFWFCGIPLSRAKRGNDAHSIARAYHPPCRGAHPSPEPTFPSLLRRAVRCPFTRFLPRYGLSRVSSAPFRNHRALRKRQHARAYPLRSPGSADPREKANSAPFYPRCARPCVFERFPWFSPRALGDRGRAWAHNSRHKHSARRAHAYPLEENPPPL